MSVARSDDGRRTPLGHTDTHSWHAVQCDVRFLIPLAPGGTIPGFACRNLLLGNSGESAVDYLFLSLHCGNGGHGGRDCHEPAARTVDRFLPTALGLPDFAATERILYSSLPALADAV